MKRVRSPPIPAIACTATAPGAAGACATGPYLFEMSLPISAVNYTKQVQSVLFNFSAATGAAANTVDYLHVLAMGGTAPPTAGVSMFTTPVISTTTTYYVQASYLGCNSTPRTAVVANVTNPPVVTIPSNTTICEGDVFALTASSVNDPNYTYTWNPGNLTGASVNVTPSATTIYTLTSTDNSGNANNGCVDIRTVTITVNQRPTITSLTATPSAICAGDSVQINLTAAPFIAPGFVGAYSLSSLTGQTYSTLTGGGITIINTAAQLLTGLATGNSDDGGVVVTLPGFTFPYDGVNHTQMVFETNGWVGAGASNSAITAGPDRTAANLFTSTLPNRTLAAWFKDMGANFPTGVGSMRHGLTGTGIYSFQWDKAVGSGFSDGSTILISFQVNVYGSTSSNPGRIEYIYGPTVGTIATAASIGIEDNISGTNHYVNALNGLSNSTVTSTGWPGNGNGYRFTPVPASSLSYSWLPAASLNNASAEDPKAGPTANTIYTVTVNESGTGCHRNGTVSIVASAIPTPTITPGSATICEDGNFDQYAVDLTGPYSVANGGYPSGTKIEWIIDGFPTTPFLDPAVGVNTTGNGTFRVIVHLPLSLGSCASLPSALVTVDHHLLDINLTAPVTDATCGNSNGKIKVNVNGTPPYNYIWSNGRNIHTSATSDSIVNLIGGNYTLTVIDNEGLVNPGISCSKSVNYNVQSLGGPVPTITTVNNETCFGVNDGNATISISGGTSPITIQWSSGSTAVLSNNVGPGTYTVTVTDVNLCANSTEVIIYGPAAALTGVTSFTPPTCNMSNGSISVVASGGRPLNNGGADYDYTWYADLYNGTLANIGTNSPTVSGVDTGVYYVVISDSNGTCSTTDTVIVTQNCSIELDLTAYIEGFYSGGTMTSPLNNSGVGIDPNDIDTITVVLYDQFDPTIEVARTQAMLHANGTAMAIYPPNLLGGTYYIAILTRNAIETWSKTPVTFGATTNFDFTH